jgi:hypothetical protein
MTASLPTFGFIDDWRRALCADSKLSNRARLLGMYMARSCAGTDQCSLSFTALATATALGRGETVQMIGLLIDRGWLRKIESDQRTNSYKLLLNGTSKECIAAATASKLGIRPESLA